jgi:hypothetical protein
MKFRVTMKTPDALNYALEDLEEQMIEHAFLDKDERDEQINEAREFAEEYMEWSEYLRVEFDTEAKTVTVLKL